MVEGQAQSRWVRKMEDSGNGEYCIKNGINKALEMLKYFERNDDMYVRNKRNWGKYF